MNNNEKKENLNSHDLLFTSWTFGEDTNVSKLDEAALLEDEEKNLKLKLSYFYPTHVLPHPWWGNVENPEIIVLAKNPSYAPIDDEKDELDKEFKDDLMENIKNKDKSLNLFKFINTETFKWWKETIGELYKEGDDDHSFIKKVGFFNLCGYHSEEFKQIKKLKEKNQILKDENFKDFFKRFKLLNETNKFIYKYNYKYLPTQNAVGLHVQKLINNPSTKYIIVIWGYDKWVDLGVDFSNAKDKLLIVNKYNYRNRIITSAHKITNRRLKQDITDFCDDIKIKTDLEKENKAREIQKKLDEKYSSLYEDIRKVIYLCSDNIQGRPL